MVEFFTFLSNLSTIENFHHEFLSIDDLTPGCHLQVDAIFQISRLLFNIDIQVKFNEFRSATLKSSNKTPLVNG
ncbi:unnamed protein product [Rotaria sp. Silwood1]|nr:unnamed protein product [Rotaria sp. Silwood1]